MTKKILCALLAVMMLFALVACGDSGSSTPSSNPSVPAEGNRDEQVQNSDVGSDAIISTGDNRLDKITLAYNESIDSLTPDGGIKGGTIAPILNNVMEGLFIIQDGDYFGIMAKDWKEADPLHYDVEIYDYITDSEGNHITAEDVVYSYEYFVANGTIPKYDLYAGVEATGEYTVRFTWTEEPTAILALEHIWGGTAVVSKAAHESHTYATDPIGTGPYVVKEFAAGERVVLEARDDYWQKDELRPAYSQANVQLIQYDCIPETSQRVIALETDAVDFSAGVAFDSLSSFQDGGAKDANYNVDVRASGSICTLNPNVDPSSPCSDINLRMAIFYAISNEALAMAYPAGGAVAAKGLGSDYYLGYDYAWDTEENYITTYNPELAKEYLAKSSYNNEELVILCQSGAPSQIAEVVVNLLAEVNIKAKINAYDYATWLNSQGNPNNFDIIMLNSGGSGAHISLGWNRPFTNTDWGTGKTIGYVDNAELNDLLKTIKTVEGGTPENVEAMRQIWMENAYTYPTYSAKSFNVYNSQKFASMFYNCDGNLMPNACTYVVG